MCVCASISMNQRWWVVPFYVCIHIRIYKNYRCQYYIYIHTHIIIYRGINDAMNPESTSTGSSSNGNSDIESIELVAVEEVLQTVMTPQKSCCPVLTKWWCPVLQQGFDPVGFLRHEVLLNELLRSSRQTMVVWGRSPQQKMVDTFNFNTSLRMCQLVIRKPNWCYSHRNVHRTQQLHNNPMEPSHTASFYPQWRYPNDKSFWIHLQRCHPDTCPSQRAFQPVLHGLSAASCEGNT